MGDYGHTSTPTKEKKRDGSENGKVPQSGRRAGEEKKPSAREKTRSVEKGEEAKKKKKKSNNAKEGSSSRGRKREKEEQAGIADPKISEESSDEESSQAMSQMKNNQQQQLQQFEIIKKQLQDFDDEESVKLERPIRLNMSYLDSQGNRVSGVHSVANDRPEDLLPGGVGGGGLGTNPVSARDQDSNILQGSMNGGGRADTDEASKLFDENKELKIKNVDLRKKISKYKKQLELIPELRREVQNMKESLTQVEQDYQNSKMKGPEDQDDLSFGKTGGQGAVATSALNPHQLRKLLDRMEEKNYSLVKENIDLKGQISELKEQIIKRNNFIEGLRGDMKIMMNDFKYLFTKLNHGQEIPGVQDPGITAKFLVSQIDHLIEQKLSNIKELQEKCYLQEDRMSGLKDQIINLQSMVDRNQQLVVNTTAKMATLEDMNKNLKQDVTVKSESERLQETFKSLIKNRLLNLRHQMEVVTQETLYQGEGRRHIDNFADLSIEQLMDQIAERAQNSTLNERNLRQVVERLQVELQKKDAQLPVEIQNVESRFRAKAREDEERLARMQDHIKRLEDTVQKTNYERTYSQVDTNARMRAGEQQSNQLQEEISILHSFIYNLLKMNKSLSFQKSYLQAEARSSQDSLQKFEYELKSLLPGRDRYFPRQRAIKKFKKVARAVVFAMRLKRINLSNFGEPYYRKKACERLADNWANMKYFWDPNIKQHVKLFQISDGLLKALSQKPQRMKDFPKRFFQDEKLEYVDALRVKMGDLEAYATQMATRHGDQQFLAQLQNQRQNPPNLRSMDGKDVQNYIAMEKQAAQAFKRQDQLQEDLIMRLRQTVREMESKMEEMRITNDQKVKYLRQELEVRRHQLENMRGMVEFSEPSMNNIIVTNDLDMMDNKPVRVGGGFLVPSLAQYY